MITKIDKDLVTEGRLTKVETVLYEIRDNHLVHLSNDIAELQQSVGNLNVKLASWSGGIVVALWIIEQFLK